MSVMGINSKTGILANPTTTKGSIKFGVSIPAGTNIIIKNNTTLDIFVRGDNGDADALSFPTTDGLAASNARGTHIMAGSAETYEAEQNMTQLSIVANGTSSGIVSAKIGIGE